jgi:ketosteroid isomerase-like protein
LTDADHANVKLVRNLFIKDGHADDSVTFEGYVEGGWDTHFSPDITYCGTSVRGGQLQMALGKAAVFHMAREAQQYMEPDERGEELLECVAFGDEMVAAYVRCHRRLRTSGESISYEFVMLVRVEDGIITRGVDIGERKIDEVFRRLNGDVAPAPVLAVTVSSARSDGANRKESA